MAQREARIAELEQELEAQSRQNQERTQDMQRTIDEHRSQIEELRSRAEMLEQTLTDEQGIVRRSRSNWPTSRDRFGGWMSWRERCPKSANGMKLLSSR